MPDPAENERNAREFLALAFEERKPEEAAARYLGQTYVQHNPEFRDGPDGFIASVHAFPRVRIEIQRVVANEDWVVTHQRLTRLEDGSELAVADFFRVDEDGRFVEHWDVVMPVPDPAAARNENGVL
jgi:predicted SnoaL-like aldol condensation-catalyzing enzyme